MPAKKIMAKNNIVVQTVETARGRIVAYCADVSAGVIKTEDGKQYLFPRTEWRNAKPPMNDMEVAFEPRYRAAMNVSVA